VSDAEQERPERLFIAVPLDDTAREAIRRKLPTVLPGKPVPPENWHFTLRFLGSTKAVARDQIISSLRSRALGPRFSICFSDLGAFPNPRRARILWVGVDRGADRMTEIAAIAESVARDAGVEAETRKYTAHLTIARIDPPCNVVALMSQDRLNVDMDVDRIVVYRSRLGKGPARYEEVESFPLSD
jgi:2'-5' RNA ligase